MIYIENFDVPPGLSAIPEAVRQVLPEIAETIKTEIISMAMAGLDTSQKDYISNIWLLHYPITESAFAADDFTFASIGLNGWLANAVENGWDGADMKPGLLAGRNAKQAKDGSTYNTVMFRHGTPDSTGHAGAPMGVFEQKQGMSKAQAEMVGKEIHRIAKKLGTTKTDSPAAAGTSRGEYGTLLDARMSQNAAAQAGAVTGRSRIKNHKALKMSVSYQHKSSIYAGMVRQEKTYRSATQNKYSTFRRVSDKSDANSWIHPGIPGHRFFEKVSGRIPGIIDMIVGGAISGASRGYRGNT